MIEKLLREVENVAGQAMQLPRDFERLSQMVFARTGERVSPSTLKRLWGYVGSSHAPSRHTLASLVKFAGYSSLEQFEIAEEEGAASQSHAVLSRHLRPAELPFGAQLVLTWSRSRRILVRHLGDARFRIEEAANTKLKVGDTFICPLIIAGEPLYLDRLMRRGLPPTAYVAGRQDGVQFEVVGTTSDSLL